MRYRLLLFIHVLLITWQLHLSPNEILSCNSQYSDLCKFSVANHDQVYILHKKQLKNSLTLQKISELQKVSELQKFSEFVEKISELRKVTKTWCIRCYRRVAGTLWRPWCSRHYSLEMRKISISNFVAPKSCKLCTCNYSCAQMYVSVLIIAQYANICFSILWICVILWIVQKVSELRSH